MNFSFATDATVFLANPKWLPYVAFLWCVIGVLTFFAYQNNRLSGWKKFLGVTLRLIGVGLLLGCLLEPMLRYEVAKPQANSFAIALDNSQSVKELWGMPGEDARMSQNAFGSHSKHLGLLRNDSTWITELGKNFRVKRYVFGSSLKAIDSFEAVQWDSDETRLFHSVRSLVDRAPTKTSSSKVGDPQNVKGLTSGPAPSVPLAGIVLLSDGQATDVDQLNEMDNYPVPIYPVVLGNKNIKPDVSIQSVSSMQSDFETAPITILVNIAQQGFDDKEVTVHLESLSRDNSVDSRKQNHPENQTNGKKENLVATQKIRLKNGQRLTRVEFQFKPNQFGTQGYRVVVDPTNREWSETDSEQFANVESGSVSAIVNTIVSDVEATQQNNVRYEVVERKSGPHQILYVSGRPNWEFKFLSRALSEDQEVQLTGLVRVARKEAKFNFRDVNGDGSNPLYSGFEDAIEEEKEQYDEHVYVKIGGKEADLQKKGFPREIRELFQYKAIILDDFEVDMLSAEQQAMLRRYVRSRGGGLLVLGGSESFRGERLAASPIAQLLPVYTQRSTKPEDIDAESLTSNPNDLEVETLKLELSREGWLLPFMRLASNEEDERKRLFKAPEIQVWNEIQGVKPGASTLAFGKRSEASADGKDDSVPLLVTQRFGRGKSSVFLLGDWWRWGMRREDTNPPQLYQAWRQIIRWMMTDVPDKLEMSSEPVPESSRARRIIISAKDALFEPIADATITVNVVGPGGQSQTVQAEPSAESLGKYEAIVLCQETGVYIATATFTDSETQVQQSVESGWAFEPLVKEFAGIGENTQVLEQLAQKSGGRILSWDELTSFAKNVPSKDIPVKETRTIPLWHHVWVIALAIGCLCAEWGLRRRNGLA